MIHARGTTPPGAADERDAATWVRRMFEQVAPRYDLLNHLLSFNIDRGWRKALLAAVSADIANPNAKVLDLCCGTGDVMLDLQQATTAGVVGADFCHPMLVAAGTKARKRGWRASLFEADALELPLRSGTFDVISVAFGFRNFANYEAGMQELQRVLKPGGVLAILEFSHPHNALIRTSYGLYSKLVLPAIGRVISGSRDAYTYLPESIRKFPRAPELERLMISAGFGDTSYKLLTGGVAALHTGRKLAAGSSA